MANTADVVSALRELTNAKQLERQELIDLLKDGLHAALVKRYGPTVRPEIFVDEMKGTIRVVILRTVVEEVDDAGAQVSLDTQAAWHVEGAGDHHLEATQEPQTPYGIALVVTGLGLLLSLFLVIRGRFR